ncbi:MAG: hypothetical protein NVS1B4_24670 [Gemmatimonadaceae bacterium]
MVIDPRHQTPALPVSGAPQSTDQGRQTTPPGPPQARTIERQIHDALAQVRAELEHERQTNSHTTVAGGGPDNLQNLIPPQAVDISIAFFVMCAVMVIGWPIARALGRRIERRGDVPSIGTDIAAQLQRIEHAVEAMSIEVERISEAQRFMAKVQSGAVASPAALPHAEAR